MEVRAYEYLVRMHSILDFAILFFSYY